MNSLIKSIGETVRSRIHRAGLSPVEEEIRRFILMTFADTGKPPAPVEIKDALKLPSMNMVRQAIKRLEESDILVTVGGDIVSSYPFSTRVTHHKVIFDDGREVNALCATDALGISFMLKENIKIVSRCPCCDREITVVIKDSKVRSKSPDEIVELVTSKGEEGQTAKVCCPYINFFCGLSCIEGWKSENPEFGNGEIYPLGEALEHGNIIFGDFLK